MRKLRLGEGHFGSSSLSTRMRPVLAFQPSPAASPPSPLLQFTPDLLCAVRGSSPLRIHRQEDGPWQTGLGDLGTGGERRLSSGPQVWVGRVRVGGGPGRKSGSRWGLMRTGGQDVAKGGKCSGTWVSRLQSRLLIGTSTSHPYAWVTHTGQARGEGRAGSGTGRCRAPPRALAHASGLATEAPAAAGPLHPLLPFAPAPLLFSPRSQLLPHCRSLRPSPSCSLRPLLPVLTRAPGRELVGARGPPPAPSSAEPGGSAARPAAARGARAQRARARVGTAPER